MRPNSSPAGEKGKNAAQVLQLQPLGIDPAVEILAGEPLAGKVNFFRGNDPAKWRTNVPTYKSVLYREAYPGIDLKFYGAGKQLEYDLIIKPGANPKQVKFHYQGIKTLKLTKTGDLTVILPGGGKLVQKKPVIYQDINGRRVSREGKFRLLPGKRSYGFELASYDTRFPLIIDPVVLAYSTYLGGSTFESGNGIAVDAAGNAYVVGSSQSADFPVQNAYQVDLAGGQDAFITKFNSAGNTVSYSTYLGGTNNDYGFGIAVDSALNVYVTGETFSNNFLLTGAYQVALTGASDAFVTKLNAAGGLFYSTYLGGGNGDAGKNIAVDSTGMAYVTGHTNSNNFPRAEWLPDHAQRQPKRFCLQN
ncbi:MAG: SBBP repeat-containing protein [Syntrophales bacterium]|nr:SBBP repeat-containing protein [Syntrophales bacterium]MDD5641299.1 SBBP repeat-containing protein [Syntrophales bacterium]